MIELAGAVVANLDVNPKFIDELVDKGADRDLFRRLERLGRGQLDKRLVLSGITAVKKLMSIPKSEQTKALNDGVEVLDWNEKDTRIIPASDLTGKQADQVFSSTGTRSIAEQRSWIREKKADKSPVKINEDYKVKRDSVVIHRQCEVPKSVVLQWLVAMEGK